MGSEQQGSCSASMKCERLALPLARLHEGWLDLLSLPHSLLPAQNLDGLSSILPETGGPLALTRATDSATGLRIKVSRRCMEKQLE